MSDVIWGGWLDDRYRVEVNRKGPDTGELTIAEDGEVLHREDVGLAYGAQFGPDAEDAEAWMEKTEAIVDLWAKDKNDG